MKKFLTICFVCIVPVLGWADISKCTGTAGKIITDINGNKYCRSHITMNWWSANAWCDVLGMTVINPSEDCYCSGEKCDTSVRCPNLKGVGEGEVWTNSKKGNQAVYTIILYNGSMESPPQKNQN